MDALRKTGHISLGCQQPAITPPGTGSSSFSFIPRAPTTEHGTKEELTDECECESLPPPDSVPLLHENRDDDYNHDESFADGGQVRTIAPTLGTLSERAAAHLLEECINRDPSKILNEYYQKNGISHGLKTYFEEFAWEMPKGPPYWRVDFQCPIDGSVHRSGLPGPLLEKTDPEDSLVELATNFAGTYEVVDGVEVIFATKKGAKRSAALSALLNLGLLIVPEDIETPVTSTPPKKRKRAPKWVNELYSVGVRGPNLKMSYREEYDGETEWSCQPTRLRCMLEIERPISRIVEGAAESSKPLARAAAVRQLVKEFCTHGVESEGMYTSDSSEVEDKKRLLLCDPKQATYIFPVPAWATCPAPVPDKVKKVMLYVYALEFTTSLGNPLICEKTGLSGPTPLGIVFFSDICPGNGTSTYEIRGFRIGSDEVTVKLRKKMDLDIDKLGHVHERLAWMVEFNRVLHSWKSYGMVGVANKISSKNPTQEKKAATCVDRSYCFIPLNHDSSDNPVDWLMLERVSSFTRLPYLKSVDDQWKLPYFGKVRLKTVQWILLLICFAFLAPDVYSAAREYLVRQTFRRNERIMEPWEYVCGYLALAFSLVAASCRVLLPPKEQFSAEELENYFLIQSGASNSIYITCRDLSSSMTGKSKFLSTEAVANLSMKKLEYSKRKFNLDLRTATFADYYERKYGTVLRHVNISMLCCSVVTAHADHNYLSPTVEVSSSGPVRLAPELVFVLPMPRDVMYLLNHAKEFMPLLEREIQLSRACGVLRSMSYTLSSQSLHGLVKEATTLAPRSTYQRLEFLGDSVLGFFVATVLVAGNSSMQLSFDDIGERFVHATKNVVLHDGALRIGINRLLYTSQQQKWRSGFTAKGRSKEEHHHEEISDAILSDVVESVLGAAYLEDTEFARNDRDKQLSMAVLLFQRMCLPIGHQGLRQEGHFSLYEALERCLDRGYPFDKDEKWQQQITNFGHVLDRHQSLSELEDGRARVIDIFCLNDDLAMKSPEARVLLLSALLQDDSTAIDAIEIESRDKDMEEAHQLGSFREMITLVGTYAMQLKVTEELFHRFPEAREGDMHFMRACSINDDAVAYITIKAGLDKALVNIDREAVKRFQLNIMIADSNGHEAWNDKGGWILEGGREEFNRRCAGDLPVDPRYPGLAGRLFGHTEKVPPELTNDLMSGMKAIAGSLVLATGVSRMWGCIGPLFEETLLISADEMKKEFPHLRNIS